MVTVGRVDLAGKLSDARDRVEAEAPSEERGLAMFARLTRKDARIRADQDAALTALAKTLMRRRIVKSERITENTLIRVAIDLLLAHSDELRGSTEDDLRDSVIPRAHLQTSGLPNSGRAALTYSPSSGVAGLRTPGAPVSQSPVLRDSGTSEVATGGTHANTGRDTEHEGRAAGSEVGR